jgi:dihydroorotate dehydrogenase (NAD+) catalytic subunit
VLTVLRTSLGSLELDNPVLSASGTFGSGWEGRTFSDLGRVGGLVSKTVTVAPRHGNPPPRIHETASGMLNSIGLENKGVDLFVANSLPKMRQLAASGRTDGRLGPRIVINIGGESIDDFVTLAERFSPSCRRTSPTSSRSRRARSRAAPTASRRSTR